MIQHFHRGLYGGFGLVGIEAPGFEGVAVVVPGNDGLYKSVGAATGGNVDRVVGEHRKFPAQLLLVDGAHGFHKGIVLSVARSRLFILLAVYFYLHHGYRVQPLRQSQRVIEQPYLLVLGVVFQHVGNNDVGQGLPG